MQIKTVAHLSGGFDSAAAILKELESGSTVTGLFIDYGQDYAVQEASAASYLSNAILALQSKKKFPGWFTGVERRHVQLQTQGSKTDYVPMRNLVLAGMSINLAIALEYNAITVGNKTEQLNDGDPWCFRDCNEDFFIAIKKALDVGQEPGDVPIQIRMIIRDDTKLQVLKRLEDNGIRLGSLWSCYKTETTPCGECHACQEANKAKEELQNG